MKDVLLFGYYGFNNAGDEAILNVLSTELKKMKCNVSALTNDVELTNKKYGINAYKRNDIGQIKKAIKKCDVFIGGGGSIFQDVTSSKSLYYYLWLVWLAEKYNKPIHIYANGIGPITKKINKSIFKKIMNKVDSISVRDKKSYDELISLDIDDKKITPIADPVFMLNPSSGEKTKKILDDEGVKIGSGKKKIGISVRDWKGNDNFVNEFAVIADKIIEEYNAELIFVPFHYPQDKEFSRRITSKMSHMAYVIEKEYMPSDIMGIMSQMDLNIGVRLHSLIFSACTNVPVVGVSYDVKIDGFLESLGFKKIIKYDKIEWNDFKEQIDYLLKNYDKEKEKLREVTIQNRKLAYDNLKNIVK